MIRMMQMQPVPQKADSSVGVAIVVKDYCAFVDSFPDVHERDTNVG